jgi:hypothetical protein
VPAVGDALVKATFVGATEIDELVAVPPALVSVAVKMHEPPAVMVTSLLNVAVVPVVDPVTVVPLIVQSLEVIVTVSPEVPPLPMFTVNVERG